MNPTTWDILAGIMLTAVIFMLVRPGGKGAQAVMDVTDLMAVLISTAIGTTPPKEIIKRQFGNTNQSGG